MNEIKSFTIFREIFMLIDTIKPKKKRDDFFGKLCDFYFKDIEPIFEKNSYEEIVWENISKPVKKYKTNALNGAKGGRPKTKTKTENKTKTLTENESTSDVIVNVNVYVYIENSFSITISGTNYEIIDDWLKVFNEEIIKLAVDICVANGVRTIKYLDGILKNWKGCNYKTIDDVKKSLKKEKQLPEWFNKKIEKKEIKPEDEKKLKEILDKFGE